MATPPDLILVSSLNGAYREMQQRGLAVVPSDSCLTSQAEEWFKMRVPLGEEETTWDLIKVAKKGKPSCTKDGINDDRKSLEGPISMIQEGTKTARRLVDCNKTKRRKKTTTAKALQLQDSKLFRVEQNKTKVKGREDDPDDISGWWGMVERKEKRKQKKRDKKRIIRKTGTKKKQKTREEPKKGKRKYRRLQDFIEARRQKKLQKRCTLDLSAQVTLSSHNNLPMMIVVIMIMIMITIMTKIVMVAMMMMMMQRMIQLHFFCCSLLTFPTSMCQTAMRDVKQGCPRAAMSERAGETSPGPPTLLSLLGQQRR